MQVTSIVACMLETGSDAIVEHLFGDCDSAGVAAQCASPVRARAQEQAMRGATPPSPARLMWHLQLQHSSLPCVSLQIAQLRHWALTQQSMASTLQRPLRCLR